MYFEEWSCVIGENIKNIRESKNIGINELSRISGVNASYISAIERGEKQNPSTKILNKLSEALNVSVDEFFKNDAEVKEEKTNVIDDINKIVEKNKVETIAAHLDAEEFTEEDLEDIEQFIKFVASRKKKTE